MDTNSQECAYIWADTLYSNLKLYSHRKSRLERLDRTSHLGLDTPTSRYRLGLGIIRLVYNPGILCFCLLCFVTCMFLPLSYCYTRSNYMMGLLPDANEAYSIPVVWYISDETMM